MLFPILDTQDLYYLFAYAWAALSLTLTSSKLHLPGFSSVEDCYVRPI